MDSTKEIKTDNELIAEFMGGFNYSDDTKHLGMSLPFKSNIWYDYDDMRFDKSWDWLMPVVEKIASMKFPVNIYVSHVQKTTAVYDIEQMPHITVVREGSPQFTPIQATYKAVVEFLKWYNSQSK